MNWGRVIHVFFALMSLTTIAGYLYENSGIALFIAASVNMISTLLKIGVRNLLSAELFASSLVADLHLIPAFAIYITSQNMSLVYSLVISAGVANIFSLALMVVEAAKDRDEF
ncbi:DUF6394 family protein [Campylobacter geochelonis]|uniref:MacA n=1 Tax=Campylobacter geochelonis TaxID=1780362 RepID=A0A128EMD0_9BACT|nr:DUF6394 family protein [Campylobacter geochelonis]QKF70982.1 putative membrane protein [Campylobacter geochelonis]CZE47091.1 MacA [Campylobacter geochelonis]CZE47575.1 MacA [Campylobacter geochelonis]CZE50202.1 MacA [Campylobacter geochelonis]